LLLLIYKQYHEEYVGMRMIYLHAKFHMPSTSGLLVIVIKPERFHSTTILFYILQQTTKVAYFSNPTSFQDPTLNGACVTPTSQVYASVMLLLPVAGNYTV
jgi:hypothetical protein